VRPRVAGKAVALNGIKAVEHHVAKQTVPAARQLHGHGQQPLAVGLGVAWASRSTREIILPNYQAQVQAQAMWYVYFRPIWNISKAVAGTLRGASRKYPLQIIDLQRVFF
jgi:hypothetical protein